MSNITEVQMRQVNATYTAAVNIAAAILTATPPRGEERPITNFQIETILEGDEYVNVFDEKHVAVTLHFIATWSFDAADNIEDAKGNTVVRKGSLRAMTLNVENDAFAYTNIMETASEIVDQALKRDADDPLAFLEAQLSSITRNLYDFQKRNGETEKDDYVTGYGLIHALSHFTDSPCDCASCKVVNDLAKPYATAVASHLKKHPDERHTDMINGKDFGLTEKQLAMAEVIAKFVSRDPMLTHVAMNMLERTGVDQAVIDDLITFGLTNTASERSDFVAKHHETLALVAPIVEPVH